MADEIHSTVLRYQGRDFIQCVHCNLLLAIKIPGSCRKSVMESKMHWSQKPRWCNQRPNTGNIIPWCHCSGKLLTECSLKVLTKSTWVALPLCDHLDENPIEVQLSWTLHWDTHIES